MVSGISYNKVGTSYILEKAKIRKKSGILEGIYAMPDNHIAPENSFQPWRICSVETSLAYAIILIFL